MREQLKKKQAACNYRRIRCCETCKFLESYDKSDYSIEYFCGNPKNEDETAGPGEDYVWSVEWDCCCDNHEFRD